MHSFLYQNALDSNLVPLVLEMITWPTMQSLSQFILWTLLKTEKIWEVHILVFVPFKPIIGKNTFFVVQNVPSPASFRSSSNKFYNRSVWKIPSNIRYWDSNSSPSERESPITARPGYSLLLNLKKKIEFRIRLNNVEINVWIWKPNHRVKKKVSLKGAS